jgi:hypothetical protein
MAASADTDQCPACAVPDDLAATRDRPETPEQLSVRIAETPNGLAWAPASSTLDDVLFSVD